MQTQLVKIKADPRKRPPPSCVKSIAGRSICSECHREYSERRPLFVRKSCHALKCKGAGCEGCYFRTVSDRHGRVYYYAT